MKLKISLMYEHLFVVTMLIVVMEWSKQKINE